MVGAIREEPVHAEDEAPPQGGRESRVASRTRQGRTTGGAAGKWRLPKQATLHWERQEVKRAVHATEDTEPETGSMGALVGNDWAEFRSGSGQSRHV